MEKRYLVLVKLMEKWYDAELDEEVLDWRWKVCVKDGDRHQQIMTKEDAILVAEELSKPREALEYMIVEGLYEVESGKKKVM